MSILQPKLVVACQSLKSGNGGIARVDRLIESLVRERFPKVRAEFHVLSDSRMPATRRQANLSISSYGGSKLLFLLGVWRSLLKPSTVLYDAAYLAKVHPRGKIGRLRPSMIFLHGIEIWEDAKPASLVACQRANLLVANSRYTIERANNRHGCFARSAVCWLGTEAEARSPSDHKERRKDPIVLVVGRMNPREGYKGHDELIRAWRKVLMVHPDARLEIVGGGGLLPALKRLAQECQVSSRVDFRGFVSEEELAECYKRASIFALPSRGEGFGLVYVEAMRYRLPVLASVHDAAKEIVEDNVTGLLTDLNVTDKLERDLIRLLSNPQMCEVMGEAGRRRWEKQFTYDAFCRRFTPILDSLLKLRP